MWKHIAARNGARGVLQTSLNIAEQLHQHFAYEVLRIMRDVEKYPEWEECLPKMKEIVDTVFEQELAWNEYLFEGKQMLGLNKEILEKAVKFFALPVYDKLNIEAPYNTEEASINPIEHLLGYFDTSLIQTASQEIQQTGYITGSLYDDGWRDADLSFKVGE